MSNLTDFFPSGGGGGLTPKFQEFNASGTFTPSQALIDAGGYIEVFLVAGGGRGSDTPRGGSGGEAFFKNLYLTSVSSLMVAIGAGASAPNSNGSASAVTGPTGSGVDLIALGGLGNSTIGFQTNFTLNASWPRNNAAQTTSAGNGIFGYGAGGGSTASGGGIINAKPNSGQGVPYQGSPGSGYCLIKWYE